MNPGVSFCRWVYMAIDGASMPTCARVWTVCRFTLNQEDVFAVSSARRDSSSVSRCSKARISERKRSTSLRGVSCRRSRSELAALGAFGPSREVTESNKRRASAAKASKGGRVESMGGSASGVFDHPTVWRMADQVAAARVVVRRAPAPKQCGALSTSRAKASKWCGTAPMRGLFRFFCWHSCCFMYLAMHHCGLCRDLGITRPPGDIELRQNEHHATTPPRHHAAGWYAQPAGERPMNVT